jgi:putative ABC transport system substrate-binding protein
LKEAAGGLGVDLHFAHASGERELEPAFASLLQQGAGALLVAGDAVFTNRKDPLIALAARYAIPAIYSGRDFVEAGGLVSYGTSITDAYRQVGVYAGRILKGAKPADLPVLQPTKFEFVINLKTAKTLGLTVSNSMQLLADEVIE